MIRCPVCKTEYPEHVIVCANDGEVLSAGVSRVAEGSAIEDTVAVPSLASGAFADHASSTDHASRTDNPSKTPTVALTSKGAPKMAGLAASSQATVALGDAAIGATALADSPGGLAYASGGSVRGDEKLPAGFKVGEYEITRHIGSGGMASVYAGVQPVIGKDVAIKVLSRILSADHSMIERFVQEARAVNQIRHHNIVDIFALGELPDGRAYCVMELLVGETLKDRLRKGSPTYEEAVSILSQICEGLDAAHRANVVHRDLKPDNVFLLDSPRGPVVKILDFGIAKILDSEAKGGHQTRAGILMGTPEYMSPEQCSGGDVDGRTDIYLVGVMMYEIFTGRLPFSAKTPIQTINAHVSERPKDPRDYADVAPALRDLILSCLAKDPGDRPQTILEVRDRLVEIVKSIGIDVAHLAVPARAPTAAGSGTGSVPKTRSNVGASPSTARTLVHGGKRPLLWIGAFIVLALAAVGLIVVVGQLRDKAAPGGANDALAGSATGSAGSAAGSTVEDIVVVQVISDPPGATVTIDGDAQTLRAPYAYKLPRKPTMMVKVELAGHQSFEQAIALGSGESEKVIEAKLVPIGGSGASTATVTTKTTADSTPHDSPPTGVKKGAPATISELALQPSIVFVGEKATVTGTIKFDDPDGDVAQIRTSVGNSTTRTPLKMAGTKTGTAAFTLVVAATKPGPLTIDVWVHDAGDNSSNKLAGTVEAMERDNPKDADKGSASGSGKEPGSAAGEPEDGDKASDAPEGSGQ